MRKLLRGIAEFRRTRRADYAETFARLALGQSPDALLVACSDSRVVPNLFASTEPGDLFVVRNVGNLVPPCGADGRSVSDESEAAAVEFAVSVLRVTDIIVCGHSECAAMRALLAGPSPPDAPHFGGWLRHGQAALARLDAVSHLSPGLAPHNRLSQFNVLLQLDNLKTHPAVQKALAENRIALHAWWFDIARADVLAYNPTEQRFMLLE